MHRCIAAPQHIIDVASLQTKLLLAQRMYSTYYLYHLPTSKTFDMNPTEANKENGDAEVALVCLSQIDTIFAANNTTRLLRSSLAGKKQLRQLNRSWPR